MSIPEAWPWVGEPGDVDGEEPAGALCAGCGVDAERECAPGCPGPARSQFEAVVQVARALGGGRVTRRAMHHAAKAARKVG
jgi:hypothetical protein